MSKLGSGGRQDGEARIKVDSDESWAAAPGPGIE